MSYGKNQIALLKFLEKYPNRWHRIKRRKAIDAAKGLMNHMIGVSYATVNNKVYVRGDLPQMLIKQNY